MITYTKHGGIEAINLPVLGEKEQGESQKKWLCIENPFRGIWMAGDMNDEKHLLLVVPYIEEAFHKGWNIGIYDHQYPLLTDKLLKSQNAKDWHVMNFRDVEHSQRVNLLQYLYTWNHADVFEFADMLVTSLQKETGNIYFPQAARKFLNACLTFFIHYEVQPYSKEGLQIEKEKDGTDYSSNRKETDGIYYRGKYADLPHVLAFVEEDIQQVFDILMNTPESKPYMTCFQAAYDNKDWMQIQAMIGDFRVQLAKLCRHDIFWALSDNDFQMNFNQGRTKKPQVFLIAGAAGPDEDKTINILNTLVMNTFLSANNTLKMNNQPLCIAIDDLQGLYIHSIDKLFGTMRMNRIAMALGFESRVQLMKMYGEKETDILFNIIPVLLSTTVTNESTKSWFRRNRILKGQKNIPPGYIYDSTEIYNSECRSDNLVVPRKVKEPKANNSHIPVFYAFKNSAEKTKRLQDNYNRIVDDVKHIIRKIIGEKN